MQFRQILSTIAALAAVASLTPLGASANSLPPYSASGNISTGDCCATNDYQTITTPGTYTSSNLGDPIGPSQATAQISLAPRLTATADASDLGNAFINLQLDYYFQAVGPNEQVPLLISTQGSVPVQTPAPGSVSLKLDNASIIAQAPDTPDGIHTYYSFNVTVPVSVSPNTAHSIDMTLHLTAQEFGGSTGELMASLDPFITIDPTFADAHLFSLEFSDGIDNILQATPITAVLPLFAAGVGAFGLLGRRRTRKVAALATSFTAALKMDV